MKCHVKGQRGASSFELPYHQLLHNSSYLYLQQLPTKSPSQRKNVSDNASWTKLPNIHAEKSIEREIYLKPNKGLKIQDPKGHPLISKRNQSLVSKIQNSKLQYLSQGRRPTPIHIQNQNRQSMKEMVIGNGPLERQQIAENKYVENDTSRSNEQSRRMFVENDTSRSKEQSRRMVVEDDSKEKHESNNKNQPQKKKIFGNDISRENDQHKKMVVAEEESRERQQSARNKTKRSPLCQSMLIGEFLKQNGRDVEKEMENLIEYEENILLEE
ncbi:unnamed protein product [Vicia faba]|uniref:Uncharacterized protein n=1 Tax=Vicia faba TaxID=3906 RepID=A0AAV0ZW02_VICFA|nr:unnamed protein product [Vicia faba]